MTGKDTNILRKTPEEIKNGLEYCRLGKHCVDCLYDRRDFPHCVVRLMEDAVYIINQYEQFLAHAQRERAAAVADLTVIKLCALCEEDENTQEYGSDRCHTCVNKCNWKWRGVCEESSKEGEG